MGGLVCWFRMGWFGLVGLGGFLGVSGRAAAIIWAGRNKLCCGAWLGWMSWVVVCYVCSVSGVAGG